MTTTDQDLINPWTRDAWSRPDVTFPPPPVLPPPAPPAQPEPTPPLSPARRLALLVAALVIAGATGGGIVAALDRGPAAATAVPASVARTASVVTAATSGTPEAAAAVIGPSVVTVEVSGTEVATSPFGTRSQQVSDTGSGIVVRVDGTTGYILTNNHVVAAALSGGSVHITLNDGRTVAATIVGHDTTSDLAVVKVTGVSGLKAATFADSDALKVGQAVLAVGAPLGLSNTVTQGIVSTVHRPVATGESGAGAQAVLDAVQTDAAINPGNSGGALVDLAGRVVGINSAIASTGSSQSQAGNIGVGFAIPSNDAADVADQLIATGHATHAQIGLNAQDAASSTDGAPGLGATVAQVGAGGPAAKAGLQQGDLITKIGGRVVTDADSLIVAVRANKPGATVTITYTRDGATRTAKATLVASASS